MYSFIWHSLVSTKKLESMFFFPSVGEYDPKECDIQLYHREGLVCHCFHTVGITYVRVAGTRCSNDRVVTSSELQRKEQSKESKIKRRRTVDKRGDECKEEEEGELQLSKE